MLFRSQSAQLGAAVDALYYDMPNYQDAFRAHLAKLTAADVTRAVRRYLRTDKLSIAIVAGNAEQLKLELTSDDASPMTYNTPKAQAILDVDKIAEKWPLGLKADAIQIVPAERVFQ